MSLSYFEENVQEPNQFLLEKAKSKGCPIQFLSNLYIVINEYSDSMNENWNSWKFPEESEYTEVLMELMNIVPDEGYLKPEEFQKPFDQKSDPLRKTECLREYVYDVAIHLGANLASFNYMVTSGFKKELSFFERVMLDKVHVGNDHHMEMAMVGWYNEKDRNERDSKYSKSLYVHEETEPRIKHFHFYRGKDRETGGCIMLEEAKYYPHAKHLDTLKRKEVLSLTKFLDTRDPRTNLTMWETILWLWNHENIDHLIDMETKIPPYEEEL